MTKISQREARMLRRQCARLSEQIELQRRVWAREYPGGIHIATVSLAEMPNTCGRLEATQLLRHAIVGVVKDKQLYIYALPQESAQ